MLGFSENSTLATFLLKVPDTSNLLLLKGNYESFFVIAEIADVTQCLWL